MLAIKFKNFIYKLDRYTFAQMNWFRKWYGGKWSRIYFEELNMNVWVKGEPAKFLKHDGITSIEVW